MTTAEMMFAPMGELATERKQEARKILWALLGAVVIHFVVGVTLAVLNRTGSAPLAEEDKPVELTFMDLSNAPAVPKNSMFMETDESKQTEQPKEKTFESNANSIAASELPATGAAPLPSQEGKDRPSIDLESHDYALAREGAKPQPSAAPQETPQPSATPQSTPTVAPEQFAMLTSTPTPPPQPQTTPAPQQPQQSSYRPLKQQTRMSGNISNRGTSSVNAVGTPLGRYQKNLYDAIGSRWYNYVGGKRDLISIGTARLAFTVDRSGKVANLKITQNTSNEAFANVCLQSVLEIQLPPIPEDVASTLPPNGLDQEISFTIFGN